MLARLLGAITAWCCPTRALHDWGDPLLVDDDFVEHLAGMRRTPPRYFTDDD